MAQIFDAIKVKRPRSNNFNLSHQRHATMKMGYLYPILCQEVVPGDNWNVTTEHLARMQALEAPAFTNVDVFTHSFFVPYRLIWDDFEDFITGGVDGTKKPVFPTCSTNSYSNEYVPKIGGLMDHLGFPVQNMGKSGIKVLHPINRLPFSAYQLIYNEFFRDQTLSPEVSIYRSSGNIIVDSSQASNLWSLRKRAWEKDYFTSALPWAQRGAQMQMNIGGQAYVTGETSGMTARVGSTIAGSADKGITGGVASGENLRVNLSGATGSSVNELRTAFSIQRWLEKNARVGSRYIEQILGHFGVHTKDYRLQRPEYLGGGRMPVVISEVLQNSATQSTSPQGNMAGHGISVGTTARFNKRFFEHGLIMSIMSIKPRTVYMDGMPKLFRKFDKFDYLFPDFAHLGEQAVKRYEVFVDNLQEQSDMEATFGYQPRYAEYRFINNSVHGDFRNTLDFWVQPRKFSTAPLLNASFVECTPNTDLFAVPEMDNFLVTTYHKISARRPLPIFGTPSGI